MGRGSGVRGEGKGAWSGGGGEVNGRAGVRRGMGRQGEKEDGGEGKGGVMRWRGTREGEGSGHLSAVPS